MFDHDREEAALMTSAQNDDEPPPLSLRAVVIGALGVAAAIAVACDPLLATPIGVGVAVVRLLAATVG